MHLSGNIQMCFIGVNNFTTLVLLSNMKTSKVNPVRLCLLLILSGWIATFGLGYIFMKEIKLTKGYVALVDDSDYDHLSNYKWFASICNGGKVYAGRNSKYIKGVKRFHISMHRYLLGLINTDRNTVVDHIDGNGLNNQRANLRICSRSVNNANKKSKVGSTSKYLGVSLWKRLSGTTCWKAQISNKGTIHIGFFETEEAAALAYNIKAIEIRGEFARLNEISS